MAKFLDDNGLLYFWGKLKVMLGGKVDAVSGKGLSTNDYTTEEKTKLGGIAAGAEVNVNADWNASSGDAQILNKPTIPTAVSQLTNDSNFATQTYVNEAVGSITSVSFQVVSELPATGAAGTIYLVSNGGSGTNVYDEYIYVSNAWEKIGSTAVDLSGYWAKTDLVAITNAEIDTILAS